MHDDGLSLQSYHRHAQFSRWLGSEARGKSKLQSTRYEIAVKPLAKACLSIVDRQVAFVMDEHLFILRMEYKFVHT